MFDETCYPLCYPLSRNDVKVSFPKVKVYGPKQMKALRTEDPVHALSLLNAPWPSPPCSFPRGLPLSGAAVANLSDLVDHWWSAALAHTLAFLPLFPAGTFSLPFFISSSNGPSFASITCFLNHAGQMAHFYLCDFLNKLLLIFESWP